jgi:dolichol-phosphate mannosyltransferase
MSSEMLLSVVIPAHNEEGGLRKTVDAIDRTLNDAGIPHEILVVDDHSTDGTGEILEWLQTKYPSLRTVPNLRAAGFGNAVHTGLDEYRGDAVCLVMADASDDPQDIVAYYRKLEEGYECAFGSRFAGGGKVVDYPAHKLVLNRLANFFIQLIFGLRYNDVTGAFKCYRRAVIDGIRPILSHHFNITVELPLKAIVRGYSYHVTPIHGRVTGVSKLRIREMGSRYLFIVLYVLLEKLLSRGDYRRATEAGGISGAEPAPAKRSTALLWLVFASVVLAHLLFIKTYPLNDLGGDTPGYVHLMMQRRSNLGAAPGYPFLAGLPLSIASINALAYQHLGAFHKTLLFAQHAFDLFCLAVFMCVLARVYNRRTAAIATLIAGLSLQGMGVTSAVYPEWLQADFLMLTISFALLGWRARTFGVKAIWYALAFGAFTWSYLVKFNAAVVLPALLLVVLLDRLRWTARLRLLAIAAAFAVLNWALFTGLYHRPKTGTWDLSYDHSWVLMARLSAVYGGKLPYPEGIATKRWLALSAVLPPTYEAASVGPFENVNAVPANIRAPYRDIAARILRADDAELDQILRTRSLPPNFSLGSSSIPISWYVGLKESDDLGVKVFYESIGHRPGTFVADTMRASFAALRDSTVYPLFPTTANLAQFTRSVTRDGSRILLDQPPALAPPFRYSDPVLWSPGFHLFSAASHLALPHQLIVALIVLGFLGALFLATLHRGGLLAVTPVVLTLLLAALVVLSAAVLEFRWKEMRFGLPLVAMLLGIVFGWILPEVSRVVSRRIRLGSSPPATDP